MKKFTADITYGVLASESCRQLFGKATFVMDRDYDDNKMFLKLDELEQYKGRNFYLLIK